MRRSYFFILLILVFFSCKKEKSDFMWEKSFGDGHAYFIESSADSGILSCGTVDSNPYLVKLDKNKSVIMEYQSDREGFFSSARADTSWYIAAGSSSGKMLLSGIDTEGNLEWDTLVAASFNVDITLLSSYDDGSFLALGTSFPDSADTYNTGVFFVKFDTAGVIAETKEVTESGIFSVNKISLDANGNIFIPVTRKYANRKTQAACMKYSPDMNKIWETELFNNPDFGAKSLGVLTGTDGNIYVSGCTELTVEDGLLLNSFMASVTSSGSINWKEYFEKSNTGNSLLVDNNGLLLMLNSNCFIVSMISPEDGSETDRLRMFDVCDPYDTDAIGSDFDLNYEGNLVIAGSLGGNFYLAQKSLL